MVKRTIAVLGILLLMLAASGTSFAFFGNAFDKGCGGCDVAPKPLYVPVPCPPVDVGTTIVKTWSCKIVGPAPCGAPMAACGPGGGGTIGGAFPRPGLMGGLAAALATPFDWLFGGFDGVYGCGPGGLFGGGDGPCGPCYGPVPFALAAVPMAMAAPTTLFGALW
jgi:hypothetical protein